LRLRGPDVGPLFNELRRQGERQVGRQLQAGEIEGLGHVVVRQVADQRTQQIARLFELSLQRRQRGLGLARAASWIATSMRMAKPSRNCSRRIRRDS